MKLGLFDWTCGHRINSLHGQQHHQASFGSSSISSSHFISSSSSSDSSISSTKSHHTSHPTSGSPWGPIFISEPRPVIVFNNNSGTIILCKADGNPKPHISWTHGLSSTRLIPVTGLRTVKTDGSLVFKPFSESQFQPNVHQNTYQCHASNLLGTISSRLIKVKAVILPRYHARVDNITGKRGDDVLFKCHLESSLIDYVFLKAWIRDDGLVISRKHLYHPSSNSTDLDASGFRLVGNAGYLLVRNISLSDNQSKYRCQLEDSLSGHVFMSDQGILNVLDEQSANSKPKILFTSEQIHATEGSDLLLDCIAQGNPRPTVRWYKLKTIGPETELSTKEADFSYLIRQASSADNGKYVAKVNNQLGETTCQITVTISAPLTVSLEAEKFNIEDYILVTFNCLLSGYPLDGITWLKDGQKLNLKSTDSPKDHSKSNNRRGDGSIGEEEEEEEEEDVSSIYDFRLNTASRYKLNNDYSLSVRLVKYEDIGWFQCLAFNHFDSAQSSSFVSFKETEPFLTSSFEEMISEPNRNLVISCSASGQPLPSVEWLFNGKPVNPQDAQMKVQSTRVRNEISTTLSIPSVRLEHSGLYSCVFITDTYTRDRYSRIHLERPSRTLIHSDRVNVYGKPFARDARLIGKEGDNITIQCLYGGYPITSTYWKRDNQTLVSGSKYYIDLSRGQLIVRSLTKRDAGLYSCFVVSKDNISSPEGKIHVVVGTPPSIDKVFLPETRVVEEGTKVNLMCFINKGDSDLHLTWLKDGQPLRTPDKGGSNSVSIEQTKDSSSVLFKSVLMTDRGEYSCKASNKFGSDIRITVLIVHAKPKWTNEPPNLINTSLSQRLIINCDADGFPSPNITWTYRSGKSLQTSNRFGPIVETRRISTLENGSLFFDRITLDDEESQFSCSANNGVSDQPLIKVVTVKMNRPPELNINKEIIEAHKGDNVSIKCTGNGIQSIMIVWLKSKSKIRSSDTEKYMVESRLIEKDHTTESTLTIKSVSRQDDDTYICLGHNEFGYSFLSSKLSVLEKPWKPIDLRASNISSRSIEMKWVITFDGNSPINQCTVFYRPHGTSEEKVYTSPADQNGVIIMNLRPLTLYSIRVACKNSIGLSEPSDMVNVTTLQEAPEAPPTNIRVQATGSQSLKVTWSPIDEAHRHGPISAYHIGYKTEASDDSYQFKHYVVNLEEEKDAKTFTIYLTNLKPLTRYWVVVQGYNQAGSGPLSDPILGITLETSPPISPVITVFSSTESTLEITWERDRKDKSLIREYNLYYREESRNNWKSLKIDPDSRSFSLSNLLCGSKYILYMTATNSLGTGEPSRQISARTRGAAPVSPSKKTSVLWVKRSDVILNLGMWNNGGCPIHYFVIKKRSKPNNIWKSVLDRVDPDKKEVVLPGFVPGESYIILVTAKNDAGLTQAEYEINIPHSSDPSYSTSASSSSMPRNRFTDSSVYEDVPLYRNMAFILPIGLSLSIIIFLLVLAFWCINKNPQPIYGSYPDDVGKASNSLSLSELSSQKSGSRLNMASKCDPSNPNPRSGSVASQLTSYSSGVHLINDHQYTTSHQYSEPYVTGNSALDPRGCSMVKDHFATIKRGGAAPRPSQYISP
ncbi:cell adhesion molecule Dscam1-like isoform X2 [Brevipalpus obovatus]|uniref:cell adhesion molecule Dscam1-like isoform X2 n=1 Tax=Brevipalpus obovatus TaxID=246614 RepID=UPI003D9FA596